MNEEKVTEEKVLEEIREEKKIPKIFTIKKDGVDFQTLNLVIKLLGFVLIGIGVIVLIGMLGDAIWSPLSGLLGILSPFIMAFVFSYLLQPAYSKLVEKGMNHTSAALLVVFLGLVSIGIIIGGIIAALTNPLNSELAFQNGTLYIQYTGKVLAPLLQRLGLAQFIGIEHGTYLFNDGYTKALGTGGGIIVKSVITISSMFYLLPGFTQLDKSIKNAIPKKIRQTSSEIIDIVETSFTSYIKGILLDSSIVGMAYVFVLLITAVTANIVYYGAGLARYENFIFVVHGPTSIAVIIIIILSLGVLGTVTNLIPYVGPVLGGGPIALLVFLTEGVGTVDNFQIPWFTIAVIGSVILIQQLESNFMQPYIMKKTVYVHPVWVLIGLTVFGALFGALGMVLATPTLVTIKNLIKYIDNKYEIF